MLTDSTAHAPVPDPAPVGADAVVDAVAGWQRELATVGGPNTLLWFDERQTALELTHAHPGGLAMLLSERPSSLSDLFRERTAFAEALDRSRLLRTKAVELLTEHGVTSLFLALGFVSVPVGSRTLGAPLLLRTVDLQPVDGSEHDVQLVVGDAIEVNPALVELFARLGVPLDDAAIARRARTRSGIDPALACAELRAQVRLPELSATNRLVVSTFTYSKAALAADLAENARTWSRLPLVRLAAGEPVESLPEPPAPQPDADLASERLVLDLDTEQSRVVAAALAGTDVVVEAPMTAGATQTVAATLAALAGEERTALHVAAHQGHLRDARDRLADVGLDSLVVLADDDPRSRARIVEQVIALAESPRPRLGEVPEPDAAHVTHLRDRLAAHHEAVHAVREPWGVSAFAAQRAIAALHDGPVAPTSRVRLDPETLARTSVDAAASTGRHLAEAAARGAWRGGSAHDPWFGARVSSAEEARAAGVVLGRLLGPDGLTRAERLVRTMGAEASLAPSGSVAGWREDIDAVGEVRSTAEVFTADVYDAPLEELLAATSSSYREAHGSSLGMWRRNARRREARAYVRPGYQPADLHAELRRAADQARLWRERSGDGARPRPSDAVDAARSAVDGVRSDLAWLSLRLQGTAFGDDVEGLPVTDLRSRLERLQATLSRAAVVPGVAPVLDGARAAGFGRLVEDLARRDVPASQVEAETMFVWWSSVLDAVRAADRRYGDHDAAALRRARDQYRSADVRLLRERAAVVLATVRRRARAAAEAHPDQVEALRAELTRPQGPRPVRELWALAGDLLGVVPVWSCSPNALPALLPADVERDVVVLESAHALTPAVAAGALARARTAVVLGDPFGPAPVGYRAGVLEDGVDDDVALVRQGHSLLDVLPLPRIALGIAYGRLDSRLGIDSELVHLPSPGGPAPAVLERVAQPGPDDDLVSPDAEIDRVVRLVLAELRSGEGHSIGIATIGSRHAARVSAAVQRALAGLDPDGVEARAAHELAARGEHVAVVPAHRLSGRMRDVVVFAPGYAVADGAAATHRFGVLNLPGGERLVAAAARSARVRLAVVTSLHADDLGRTPPGEAMPTAVDGIASLRALLHLLETAELRNRTSAPAADDDPDDPLLLDLATRLRGAGLAVRPHDGEEGWAVDLAVSRPGRPREPVAVVTDGPWLAGPRGVRERERLYEEALERRGWFVEHVSTCDLFAAPEPEAARVVTTTEATR